MLRVFEAQKGSSHAVSPATKRSHVSRDFHLNVPGAMEGRCGGLRNSSLTGSLEEQADRVADAVMATGPEGEVGIPITRASNAIPAQQSTVDGSGLERGAAISAEAAVSRAGAALPESTRTYMESRFGCDFSQVRIHADQRSAEAAASINARAFTKGPHIAFARGQYAPHSYAGRHLLAHELTHVVQQRGLPSRQSPIQRSITLTDPGGKIPDPTADRSQITLIPMPSANEHLLPIKAVALKGWLNIMCPEGNWDVDATSGVVHSGSRDTFCAPRPVQGKAHHSNSSHPTSCGCLCELTDPGGKNVEIQIDEYLTVGSVKHPLSQAGEGQTSREQANSPVVAVSGREGVDTSVGATTLPHTGEGSSLTYRKPPWLILAHELCGHGRIQTDVIDIHMSSEQGDRSAVDIENRVRREHSTVETNLGIRRGEFHTKEPGGKTQMRFGGVYRVSSGETLTDIAVRCGIPAGDMINRSWRFNDVQIAADAQHSVTAGEDIFIEGIDWHEVIREENMTSIAEMWGIPLASLKRANPKVKGPSFVIYPGDRLLIPAS